MKPRRQFVSLEKAAGKTVDRVVKDSSEHYATILYTDGTYTHLMAFNHKIKNYPISYDYNDNLVDREFIDLGIYTAEDIAEHKRKILEIKAAQEREMDLQQFERLKKKLGMTS